MAPRAVYVGGSTCTTAGLTVAISRDGGSSRQGGDHCVEAGALILADQGVCCIDELDKISCDQHSLLEAMEQQSISIAKGGVVATLRCNTAVFAASNPAAGHYTKKKSVCENLKMNSALLSRFDLVFVLVDKPDEDQDRRISEHIAGKHHISKSASNAFTAESHTNEDCDDDIGSGDRLGGTLTQSIRRNVARISQLELQQQRQSQPHHVTYSMNKVQIKRYIEYAKKYVHPVLTPAAAKVLQKMYLTMRAGSTSGQTLPVTTRHLESLIRLSQARARVDLREEVTERDAEDVVQLLQESMLDTLTNDLGIIERSRKGGMSLGKQMKALIDVMGREARIRGNAFFKHQEIAEIARKMLLDKDVDSLIDAMRTESYLLLKGPKLYQLLI